MQADMEEVGDLSDVVLSWSIQEILGAEQQVHKIPHEFSSLDNYFKSFIAPLVEETRSQISTSLQVIRESPYSEIISMEEEKDTRLLYKMKLDTGYTSDAYIARNGDILVLSSFKPRIVEDLLHYGATLVMVVSTDVQHQKELRIKVSREINTEERQTKFKYTVFATNIMTNTRIWNALCSEKSMNKNFTIIKSLLSPQNMGDICPVHVGNSFPCLVEKLTQTTLNTSQLGAIVSIISAVQCKHSNHVKLIWGPPGTGKTKTISATLWALKSLKCRTLMCSPTNISVVGVCTRLLQDLKDLNEHDDTDGLPYSLGDIVLFGNKHKMDTSDIQEILLDYRVDELVNCFSSSSGWKNRIDSLISLLEDFGRTGPSCLKDFHTKFGVLAINLKKCILNLWIHLPKRCFSPEVVSNILDLLDLLVTMCDLLSSEDFTYDYVKRAFYVLSSGESTPSKHVSLAIKWVQARLKCLELLKSLKISFDLPVNVSKSWARNYCMHNATLIFCTVSSSYHIHDMETTLDVLIIDEAAQVRECESVIPLRLNGLRHAVLVGDDCQLQPIIQSRVCEEAGLGVSLFKRLSLLGFEKHLLNMQYRMSPCISLFPNAQFYEGRIIDNINVKSASYNKDFLDLPFGSYAFLNIVDGKEEREGSGNSWGNMVEVAVVMHLIQTIFKSWNNTRRKMTIGVVSPYSSQVNAIKSRLGTKYDNCHGFSVRVASIDGFQGEEDDIIILSTVRSNAKGAIGFLADNQRTNVTLTRARHCLWILGNAWTLSISGTIWTTIAEDAKKRGCLFNATDNAALAKLVFEVKAELDQLGDLLNSGSAAFCNTKWKIVFSMEFRNAFMKLKSAHLQREVLQKLVGLGCGWRSRVKNIGATDKFELAKVYKISDLYLVWSIDLENGGGLFQIIRIWGLVALQNIGRTIQRLQNLFSMYTDDYVKYCKIVHREGKWEVPVNWGIGYDIARFKKDQQADATEDDDHVDASHGIEHSKVSESFLLMKFYTLSSGVAKHLLAATDGSESDIPFEMTEEEKAIIQFPCSSFILGRSGTGKTTVLTMKLIQKEQQSSIACNGLNFEFELSGTNDKNDLMNLKDVNTGQGSIRQMFLTVSSNLCSYVKNQIFRLRRFASGDLFDHSCGLQMHDIFDDSAEFNDIPDNLNNIPQNNYPLAITFRKFLMMLDGTLCTSFFDRFYGELTLYEGGKSKSRALQDYIKMKEVDYEKFSCSYWPHFNANLTKNLDASTVFTQIISHIKGGHQACKYPYGTLEKQDYVMLSDRRFPSLNTKMRGMIYDIYLSYEKRKRVSQEFDVSDFVNSLHCRLTTEGYSGDMVDCVYIDEVQDLTINQMTLLKFVCNNVKEGFVFAGDTAQTIARGIDFRFEDIRSFFYTEFLPKERHGKTHNASDMFQLTQNLRTHRGIILLAQSIMDLLYYYFPLSVDKLNPETSLVHGDAPVLLESCNGENALTTIFGQIQNECCKRNMFGADQVILVRDDATKEHVTDIVGKQALVLTILESKGLEFEDVLMYNFFSSSPLRNKWRVICGFRKENNTNASSKEISYPEFDGIKHFLLCSELKQLYVAVTRTRQRLWICEDENDLCQPMFDYWKLLCLVQVKLLDSSLVEEMQKTSSADDWRLRGVKLFNEKQFGLASMCFQKARDEHREKWARAAHCVANGKRLVSGNWQRAHSYFVEAAEIYDSIGKHEKAATCFIKSRDFEKAGLMYLEKCGDSRLEDAAECFAMAKCWMQAAKAYFEAKCYTKCFAACFKGKHFYLGLKFACQLEETPSFEKPNSSELNATRNKYLEDCASYYFHHKDLKQMMQFVKAFSSVGNIKAFLTSRTLFNELLCFEVEMGNFTEAAGVAEHIGSVFVREGLTYSGDIAQLILLHITMNMLWNSNFKKRYLKGYVGEEKLQKKAREIVQKVSRLYYPASLEADALCDPRKSLAKLSNNLLVGSKQGNSLMKIFGSRAILDIHLLFRSSEYTFELCSDLENVRCCQGILSHNRMSPKSLICTWNIWKSVVLKVLLKKVPSRTLCPLNISQDVPLIHNYWTNELYAVGIRVLKKLESLARISSEKAVHPYVQGAIVLAIYETAKFLRDTKTSLRKSVGKSRDIFVLDERLTNNKDSFKSFFVLSEHLIFELVFHDCEDQTECSLVYILSFPEAVDLLVQYLNANVTLLNQRFTCEKLRKLITLLLLSGRLDERMIYIFMVHLSPNSKWERFFRALRSFLGGGSDGGKLLMLLHSVGPHSIRIWRLEVDYSSPMYYDNILKWFSLWASTYTKSVFVEMQRSSIGGCLTPGQDLDLDYASNAYRIKQRPVVSLITNLLSKRSMLHRWILKTKACFHLPILLRLVMVMYISAISHHLSNAVDVSDFLSRHGVLDVLPHDFSEKIQHTMHMRSCTVSDLVNVFADALAAMGNHLVVMGLPEGCLMCYDLIACIVNIMKMRRAEKHQFSSPTATIKCTRCSETKDLICGTGLVAK